MRGAMIVIGVILIIGGVAAFLGKLEYPHDKEVARIGSISATVSQDKTVPQWAGGIAALVGLGLVAAGAMRKS
ncbi:MAG: hypothetical protein P4L92_12565 [Rudaea sp.]|nr:hypothetical protein [Rudaea sp.]